MSQYSSNYPWNSSTTTQQYYTIGTTTTAQQIGWNGGTVRIVSAPPPTVPKVEKPLDWLKRRVDEYRVALETVG